MMNHNKKRKKEYLYNENADITKYAKRKWIKSIEQSNAVNEPTNEVQLDVSHSSAEVQNKNTFTVDRLLHHPNAIDGPSNKAQFDLSHSSAEVQNKNTFTVDQLLHQPNAIDESSNEVQFDNNRNSTEILQNNAGSFVADRLSNFPENALEEESYEMQNLYLELGKLPIIREYISSPNDVPGVEDLDSNYENIILERGNERANNVQVIPQRFLEPISIFIEKSPGELLLMALKHCVQYKQSFSAIIGQLQLVNQICGDKVVPETRYMIEKLYNSVENLTFYGLCTYCSNYLGTFDSKVKYLHCLNCASDTNVSNSSKPSYFVLIDPSDAIRNCLQNHEKYYENIMKERIHQRNNIKDIYDGKCYRNFCKNLSLDDRSSYVTVVLNADGAPVFKSSNYSIWPFYIMPNEIPIQDRLNSIILVGIWYGKKKPEMNVILDRIVNLLTELSVAGIRCKINGNEYCVKLFLTVCCVDTIARAPMNGTSQFNGNYGCDWCEHPGKYYQRSMRYPYLIPPPKDRTKDTTIKYAKKSLMNSKPYMGVNNASPLLTLDCFDVIKGFCPDYMHCMLAGIATQFTEYFITAMTINNIVELDDLLLKLKVPTQIGRLSRPITERRYWKCKEWENWVLYYSLPLLKTVFKDKKLLEHWSLFVESLHIALQTNITYDELNYLQDLLHRFVAEVEGLYTLKAMTYNVHQLIHIPASIADWGPLWAHSAFSFESANFQLLRAIHCGNGVIFQVLRYVKIQKFIEALEKNVYPNCTEDMIQYLESIYLDELKNAFKFNLITYFGKEMLVDQNYIENFNVSKSTKMFSKIVHQKCLFTSSRKVNERSCNYFAQLNDKQFIKIIDFLLDVDNNKEITASQVIETRSSEYTNVIKKVVNVSNRIIAVPTNEIAKVCVWIECNNCRYIIPVVNLLKY